VSSAGMSRRRNPEKLRSSVGTNRGCAIGIQRNSEIVSTVQVLAARLTLSLSRNAPRTADLASKGARTEWSQLRDLNSRPAVYEITHTRCRKGQQRTKRQKLSSRDCFDNGTKVNSGYEKGVQMGVAPSLAPRVAPRSSSGPVTCVFGSADHSLHLLTHWQGRRSSCKSTQPGPATAAFDASTNRPPTCSTLYPITTSPRGSCRSKSDSCVCTGERKNSRQN